jgi:predicted DNA-binding protein
MICEFYYVDKSNMDFLPKCHLMINVMKEANHDLGVFGFTYFKSVNETTSWCHCRKSNPERYYYSIKLRWNDKIQTLGMENNYNEWQHNLIKDKNIFYSMIENIHLYTKDFYDLLEKNNEITEQDKKEIDRIIDMFINNMKSIKNEINIPDNYFKNLDVNSPLNNTIIKEPSVFEYLKAISVLYKRPYCINIRNIIYKYDVEMNDFYFFENTSNIYKDIKKNTSNIYKTFENNRNTIKLAKIINNKGIPLMKNNIYNFSDHNENLNYIVINGININRNRVKIIDVYTTPPV